MKKLSLKIVDLLISIAITFLIPVLKRYRLSGSSWPRVRRALDKGGLCLIVDHYYEPQFIYNQSDLKKIFANRLLPIDLNIDGQLSFISKLKRTDELLIKFSQFEQAGKLDLSNGTYEAGDAEFLYQFIREVKPKKIIEIGCGNSSKIMRSALEVNYSENSNYACEYTCIEPYLPEWFDADHKNVIRKAVEDCPLELFLALEEGDFLFIDSSHVIRPGGDVLFEYLSIIPRLNKGVFVHVHDIFTPNYYPLKWIEGLQLFWNEQYIFEALMTDRSRYKVIAALNFLKSNYFELLKTSCPFLGRNHNPGAFYFQIK
jgi:predicted O-methyltransferase YrrM